MSALLAIYELVEQYGMFLAILAWPVALLLVIGLGWPLRGRAAPHRAALGAALVVSLSAHLLDFGLTLYITPDLAMEANPLWRQIVDRFGLSIALVYGLTGKLMVGVMHAECVGIYLILRDALYPPDARDFWSFVRGFGAHTTGWGQVSYRRIAALLSFVFGGFGLFFYYISLLNFIGFTENFDLYERLPSPLIAAFLWGTALGGACYIVSYRAYRRGAPTPMAC